MTRSYYRIMLGRNSSMAQQCFDGGYIASGGWGMESDLSQHLTDDARQFNQQFIPVYLEKNPEKTKMAGALACGMLHTICRKIQAGDIVLCPDGANTYWVGDVTGPYYYAAGESYPHRRKVQWREVKIPRSTMSQPLQYATGAIGTVSNITKHMEEIEGLIGGKSLPQIVALNAEIEDPSAFAMEKHLEEFLVHNWPQTELGKRYEIYAEDGELVGQQYPSDTGAIDILAISKDKKELLVVELKKGRASDVVVGQIQRYMGYVQDELAEDGQTVRGVIIALEDDLRLRRALSVANNIEFYRYQVSFKLFKG